MSLAAQLQGHVTDDDAVLTRRARRNWPQCEHWWGVRLQQRAYPKVWGALCYLHGAKAQIVVRWAAEMGISDEARFEMQVHRLEHMAALGLGQRRGSAGRARRVAA